MKILPDFMTPAQIIEWLHATFKPLLTFTDDLRISHHVEEGMLVFVVKVNPSDAGRVVGKEGKTIKAIRHILYASRYLNNVRLELDVPDRH